MKNDPALRCSRRPENTEGSENGGTKIEQSPCPAKKLKGTAVSAEVDTSKNHPVRLAFSVSKLAYSAPVRGSAWVDEVLSPQMTGTTYR